MRYRTALAIDHRAALVVATFFAALCLAVAALVLPRVGFAAGAKNVTNFGDKDFSADEVVSALKPRLSRGLTIGEGNSQPEATQSDSAPAAPPPAPTISLQLRFAINSADLTADAQRRLEPVAVALTAAEMADTNLIVSGHTDISGSLAYNVALSQRRAESVRMYLVARGVEAKRLKAVGRGPTELLDEEHPKSAVNRRVQLEVAS